MDKLEKEGYFREEIAEKNELEGLRPRGNKPTYQEEVRQIDKVEGRYVYDTEGRRSLAKRVLPLTEYTRDNVKFQAFAVGGDQRIQGIAKRATTEVANRVAAILAKGPTDISRITLAIAAEDKTILKLDKLTTRKLIVLRPEILQI
jgi:hypothetical protein